MRRARCQCLVEQIGLCANLGASGRLGLARLLAAARLRLWKERHEHAIAGHGSDIEKILVERVLVLLDHAFDVVLHVAGIVLDVEAEAAQLKVRVRAAARRRNALHKRLVGAFGHGVHRFAAKRKQKQTQTKKQTEKIAFSSEQSSRVYETRARRRTSLWAK